VADLPVAKTPAALALQRHLVARGFELIEIAPPAGEGICWPEIGRETAEVVADGRAPRGIALCWTGIGISISAGTVPNVRAAYCTNLSDAHNARQWHDANLLALSLDEEVGDLTQIADAWLTTASFDQNDHARAQHRMDRLPAGA
jgi:ribose 5-phosphate isomerase B